MIQPQMTQPIPATWSDLPHRELPGVLQRLIPPFAGMALLLAAIFIFAPVLSYVFAGETRGELIEVRILPLAEVMGEMFTLGEVSEMEGEDLSTIRKLAAISMGRSPKPGRVMRLNRSYVLSRLNRVIQHSRVRLNVPQGVKILRSAQSVKGEEVGVMVLKEAASALGVRGSDIQQKLLAKPADVLLPMGKVEWEIKQIGDHLTQGGTRTYLVTAHVSGSEVYRTRVRVTQTIFRKVLIAKRPIRRNQWIRAEDIKVERRNVGRVREERYLTQLNKAVGHKTKRPIGRDEWIHPGQFANAGDISEGGPVTLIYQTKRVRFRARGVSMVPGKVGALIPVRNLGSGKIVYGVLEPNDIVKVN